MFPVIAVGGALGASATDGITAVLDERSTKQVAVHRSAVSVALIFALLRRPLWVLAICLQIIGVVFQIVALRFGALALVQPILVCDLIFAVVIASALRHRRPGRVILTGVFCCAGGLAWFLAVAQPHGGSTTVSLTSVIPLGAGLAAVLVVCLAVARAGPRTVRPIMLALGCGVCYGVMAFLFKLLSAGSVAGLLGQWPLWVVVVVGPLGFLLNESALQIGILIAPVLSVITAADPLVSIALAHLWLHESIGTGPADITMEVIALVVMITGIVVLAHGAPQVAQQLDAAPNPP
jgi:drug/metabolite transporter (DMT)-like permease